MTYDNSDIGRMKSTLGVDFGIFDAGLENDAIIIENLETITGHPEKYESYKKIMVPRKYPTINGHRMKGYANKISSFYETEGWMVPSMPLACSILERLVLDHSHEEDGKLVADDSAHYELLNQEDFPFNPRNLNTTNSLVDFHGKKVIHYPTSSEMLMTDSYQDTIPINDLTESRRVEMNLDLSSVKKHAYGDLIPSDLIMDMINISGGFLTSLKKIAGFFDAPLYQTIFPYTHGKFINKSPQVPNIFMDQYGLFLNTVDHTFDDGRIPLVKVIEE